jgi:ATP-dependent DNA helicase RecG
MPTILLKYFPKNDCDGKFSSLLINAVFTGKIEMKGVSANAMSHTYEAKIGIDVFTNYGTFIPESVEAVVLKDAPEEYYRNPFLVEAMKNLNMIDTQGGGIRKIFNYQRQRFFPMPDYDFEGGKVKVVLTGKILDENFAKILMAK